MNVRERSVLELVIAMGLMAIIAWIGMAIGSCRPEPAAGSMLLAIDDPNACIQTVWGGPLPAGVEPNDVAGTLIACETIVAGKYNRTGRACDPDGDPIDVELVAGPPDLTIDLDREASTWSIACELAPGLHALVFRARDQPRWGDPCEVTVTVLVDAIAPPNERPVLN